MNNEVENLELSLEGILQALASVNLEEGINLTINDLLKEEIINKINEDNKVLKIGIRGRRK